MGYSIESTLGELLDNAETKAILEKHLPGISNHPQITMGRGFALKAIAPFSGGLVNEAVLGQVDVDLKQLGA
ncbi:hypothetical protein PSH66_10855 [Pseudomonas sp. FP597]|uniref:Uncharacterized protein n=1 Tax=Pseudomonas lactucae TaxID=2813360 RepID=A0A9X0YD82_9PSED|nr:MULTISPECIES: hypothetical protein [Pseudomonas]MBN2977184.1 hypothetical protein [Pseudomonas lactucae]MBN2988273.1 hypothetical protein [Pseudomonas lactucae]WLI08793.1 hypothetical protein PSH66_10855 [Pseudomonas sp. FP597]